MEIQEYAINTRQSPGLEYIFTICSDPPPPNNQPAVIAFLGSNNGDSACWQCLYGCSQAESPLAMQENGNNNDNTFNNQPQQFEHGPQSNR